METRITFEFGVALPVLKSRGRKIRFYCVFLASAFSFPRHNSSVGSSLNTFGGRHSAERYNCHKSRGEAELSLGGGTLRSGNIRRYFTDAWKFVRSRDNCPRSSEKSGETISGGNQFYRKKYSPEKCVDWLLIETPRGVRRLCPSAVPVARFPNGIEIVRGKTFPRPLPAVSRIEPN